MTGCCQYHRRDLLGLRRTTTRTRMRTPPTTMRSNPTMRPRTSSRVNWSATGSSSVSTCGCCCCGDDGGCGARCCCCCFHAVRLQKSCSYFDSLPGCSSHKFHDRESFHCLGRLHHYLGLRLLNCNQNCACRCDYNNQFAADGHYTSLA